jgi:hypothetical protein
LKQKPNNCLIINDIRCICFIGLSATRAGG